MSWLLSPLAWLFLAALVAPVAWRLRSGLLAGVCLTVAMTAFAASTPLLANLLVRKLERAVVEVPQCVAAPPDTVVVLAGGVDRPPRDRMDFGGMNQASKRRMERGVQYWRQSDGRRMVIAGGTLGRGPLANADLMLEYALWLGMPAEALRTDSGSPMMGAEYAEYEGEVAALRGDMEEEAFEAGWETGRRLTLEQAIQAAL